MKQDLTKQGRLHFKHSLPLLILTIVFCLGALAHAQNGPSQNSQVMPPQDNTQVAPRDNDVRRGEMAGFDQFMDRHPEIAEQLRKDPSLVNNEEFVEKHPALQEYLQRHPEAREELRENPNAFMRQEQRFDRREDDRDRGRDADVNRRQLAGFDQFMDRHPEIAEQLRKNPSLMDDKEFVKAHPALQEYMEQHPEAREEIKENPNAFMRQEQRFDRREDRGDHDTTVAELTSFNHFLGDHSNIGRQLSEHPELANSKEYMQNHPELQEYLQAHPGVREELKENPQVFMSSVQKLNNGSSGYKNPANPEPKPKQ
jgi:hypothetical protein